VLHRGGVLHSEVDALWLDVMTECDAFYKRARCATGVRNWVPSSGKCLYTWRSMKLSRAARRCRRSLGLHASRREECGRVSDASGVDAL